MPSRAVPRSITSLLYVFYCPQNLTRIAAASLRAAYRHSDQRVSHSSTSAALPVREIYKLEGMPALSTPNVIRNISFLS